MDSEEDDLYALLELSLLLKEIGDISGAIEYCERVLDIDPDNHRAVRFLVNAYSETGRRDKASSMLENAPTQLDGLHPRVSNPDVWRAWTFADVGDFESATIHLEKALKHMPEDRVNWEEREYYYVAMSQQEKAEKCRDKIRTLRNTLS